MAEVWPVLHAERDALVLDTAKTTRLSFVAAPDGPTVTGSALSLLLTFSGRAAALAELDGAGAAVLARRLSESR